MFDPGLVSKEYKILVRVVYEQGYGCDVMRSAHGVVRYVERLTTLQYRFNIDKNV